MKISKLRRITAVFLSVMMVILVMPITSSALTLVNIKVSDVKIYSSGCLESFKLSYHVADSSAAAARVSVQKTKFDSSALSDAGSYAMAHNYPDWPASPADCEFVTWNSGGTYTRSGAGGDDELTIWFTDGTVDLNQQVNYYVYVWANWRGNTYPDAYITEFTSGVGDFAIEYTVTFDPNGGALPDDVSETAKTTDCKLTSLPTPTYAGHTFKGWFTESGDGDQVTLNKEYTGNTTIYAHWEETSGGGNSGTAAYSTAYAYDCFRDPTYPKKGDTIILSNFNTPLNNNGSHNSTTEGNWKLVKTGGYDPSYESGEEYSLSLLLSSIAYEYGVSSSDIDVYELLDGNTHICYGVLCATLEKGYFFIGTSYSGGGGYFLSNEQCSGTIEEEVTGDCSSPADPTPSPDPVPEGCTHNYVWKYDENGHWQECTKCGETTEKSEHTCDYDKVVNINDVCSVCGYTYEDYINDTTSSEPNSEGGAISHEPSSDTSSDTSSAATQTTYAIPFIVDKDGRQGWSAIEKEIERTPEGGTVNVDMNGAKKVPKNIFKEIQGKDIDLVIEMGNGIVWTINGMSVTDPHDVTLRVTMGSKSVPQKAVDEIDNVEEATAVKRVRLEYSGNFGFEGNLSLPLGEKYDGLYANLFYYNPKTGALEFSDCDIIKDGSAEFRFTHASEYVIVIGKTAYGSFEDAGTAAGAYADCDILA